MRPVHAKLAAASICVALSTAGFAAEDICGPVPSPASTGALLDTSAKLLEQGKLADPRAVARAFGVCLRETSVRGMPEEKRRKLVVVRTPATFSAGQFDYVLSSYRGASSASLEIALGDSGGVCIAKAAIEQRLGPQSQQWRGPPQPPPLCDRLGCDSIRPQSTELTFTFDNHTSFTVLRFSGAGKEECASRILLSQGMP